MKRFLLFVFMVLVGLPNYAQNELIVKSFIEDTKDLAARTSVRYDLSDEPCALIKVYMAVNDATFSGNVVHSEMKAASEYWVYVPHGTKHLQINTTGYLPIDVVFANYGIAAVTKQITYKLIINVPELTNKPKAVTEQYVEFTVEPKNAMVEFDGEVLPLDNYGNGNIYKHFGTYSYRVTANLYHSQQGEVVVKDPQNAHRISVRLQPAYGYINVPNTNTWKDAKVYINNEMIGTTPFTSNKLPSGRYNVRVVRPMYSSEEQWLVVEDGKTATFSKPLQPQFVTLKLSTKDNAEIWINGKKYNNGTWRGDLGFGSYKVECKKANHRTAETTLNVTFDMATTIDLPSPTPITGALDITSTPSNAEIFLDGKKVGATPMKLPNVVIGSHTIAIKKENYELSEEHILLTEGKTCTISKELKEIPKLCSIDIIGSPKGASVYIDEVFRGLLPITVENLERGKTYEVRVEKSGYSMEHQKITIKEDIEKMSFNLSNAQQAPIAQTLSSMLISSNPAYASIYVDDVNVGLTPKNVELEIGRHIIRIKKYGYKDSERVVNVTTEMADVSFDLERDYSVSIQEDTPSKSETTINKHQRNRSALHNKNVKHSWDYQSYYDANGEFTMNYFKAVASADFYPGTAEVIGGSVSCSFLGLRYKFFGMDLLDIRCDFLEETVYWEPQICLNFPINKNVTFLLNAGASYCPDGDTWVTTSFGCRYSLRWIEGDFLLGYNRSLFLGISFSFPYVFK